MIEIRPIPGKRGFFLPSQRERMLTPMRMKTFVAELKGRKTAAASRTFVQHRRRLGNYGWFSRILTLSVPKLADARPRVAFAK